MVNKMQVLTRFGSFETLFTLLLLISCEVGGSYSVVSYKKHSGI